MGTKKFLTLLLIFFALFSMSLGGMGCGSSGGTSTSDNNEEIDYDLSVAEYALGRIVIGYQGADNPKYVTQNLSLDKKIGSADISWSSSSSTISSNGTVTRQDADTNVTLTATATYNEKSASRDFNLKVIKKRTRDNGKIESLPIETASSGDLSVTRNASGDVQDIEGNYVSFDIENADDALDAVTVIKDELGISSPIQELLPAVITSDKYGAEYQFRQVHNGVKVFGRGLMASANAKGKGDFLHSNLLPSEVITKADDKNDIGKSAAENAAKSAYAGNVEVDSEQTEKIIYSLENHENDPVYAYIVRISGISSDGYVDESVFVNATNGKVLVSVSNSYNAESQILPLSTDWHGVNELEENVKFPVWLDSNGNLCLIHNELNIVMYSQQKFDSVGVERGYALLKEAIGDKHLISAYTNMIDIVTWWKTNFDRDPFDSCPIIAVVTHANNSNAYWKNHYILIGDKLNSEMQHTYAATLDILTHEATHAVMEFSTSNDLYMGTALIINEAYADVLACVKTNDWKIGEEVYRNPKYRRNIKEPDDNNAIDRGPSNMSEMSKYNSSDPHVASLVISHAAYLMHKGYISSGLTWDELGKVWYKSMSKGFDVTSDYKDVRRCVVWAAQEMELSSEKLAVIKAAFDEVGIKGQEENYGTIYGTVIDSADKTPLEVVQVTAYEKRLVNGNIVPKIATVRVTDADGKYTFDVEAGNYHISFDKTFYKTESFDKSIKASEDILLDVALKKLNSISGTVRDGSDENKAPLGGVSVQLFEKGMTQDSTTTASDGSYLFELNTDKAGDYTLTFSLDGYKDGSLSVHVDDDAGEVSGCDIELERDEEVKISGVVKSSPDMELLPDATVQLFEGSTGSTEKTPIKTATTDSSGAYSFTLNENGPGAYTMVFSKTGYAGTTISVTVKNGLTVAPVAYLDEEDEIPIDEEHFPDANFRSYVKTNFDKNNDSMLSKTERSKETGIWVDSSGITSLQGIEYFTALLSLQCRFNQLTYLDLSKNTTLTKLWCNNNQLVNLDVTGCVAIREIDCANNQLIELNVNDCIALSTLLCNDNQLTTLDVSRNVNLGTLDCGNNKITVLDVIGCVAINHIDCANNQLTELNVNDCTTLRVLWCEENQLRTLDVEKNTRLDTLYCNDNQLTVLDVSKNTNLQVLKCNNNQLKTLDLSNNRIYRRGLGYSRQYNYSYGVVCDDNVSITWPSSVSSSSMLSVTLTAKANASNANGSNTSNALTVIASIPQFTATRTGEYVFDVSLDKEIPEDSRLILLNASEDLNGVFISGDKNLKVSGDFEAGRTYAPVVVAKSEETSENGGGCNTGVMEFALMFMVFVAKKRAR